MTVTLGDIRLDRIEESPDIGNVPHPDFPEAPAPCLEWLQPAAIDPVTGHRHPECGMVMGEECHRWPC